jgi:hypothetical protein
MKAVTERGNHYKLNKMYKLFEFTKFKKLLSLRRTTKNAEMKFSSIIIDIGSRYSTQAILVTHCCIWCFPSQKQNDPRTHNVVGLKCKQKHSEVTHKRTAQRGTCSWRSHVVADADTPKDSWIRYHKFIAGHEHVSHNDKQPQTILYRLLRTHAQGFFICLIARARKIYTQLFRPIFSSVS